MELRIPHPDLRKNQLTYRRAGFLSRPGLFLNGKRLQSRRGKYQITKDDGQTAVMELKSSWRDPIPEVMWDSQTIRLVRPFTWLDLAGPALPILPAVFTGHYLAALFCLFLLPHLADGIRKDGCGPARYYVFGLKAGCILLFLFALAWLTYPGIRP